MDASAVTRDRRGLTALGIADLFCLFARGAMDTPLPFGKPPAVSALLSEHTKTPVERRSTPSSAYEQGGEGESISAHLPDETNWDQSETDHSLTPKTPLRKLRELVRKEWDMSSPGGVPYRGIAPPETPTVPPSTPQPDAEVASPATLRERWGKLKTSLGNFMFAPRASDWVLMINKLEDQFTCLEAAHERYLLERDGSSEFILPIGCFYTRSILTHPSPQAGEKTYTPGNQTQSKRVKTSIIVTPNTRSIQIGTSGRTRFTSSVDTLSIQAFFN